MTMYDQLLKYAIEASFLAGEEILNVYNLPFAVEYKEDASPVTLADKRAGKIIEDFMKKTNIPVLGEEGEQFGYEIRKNWDCLWIVDPLDGTKEFVKRNGEFTVNIALCEKQQPVIGVIYSPVYKVLYFAAKGLGAFKVNSHDVIHFQNSEKHDYSLLVEGGKKLPIANNKSQFTVVASRSHLSKEINHYLQRLKAVHGDVVLINTGSSIKMCLVAEGIADEYPRFGDTMEWDTCAGQCIVEQAGGVIIDCETNLSLKYNKKELLNNWFIVSLAKH